MSSLSVIPSDFGVALLLIWCIVSIRNAKALIMAASLLLYWLVQNITSTNFLAFIATASAYFYLCGSNIKFSLQFRKAFFAFGVVYFIGALDQFTYYHFDLNTQFDRIQPYLVTFINAYVLAYLLSDWRRNNVVGLADYCAMWLRRSKIRSTHNR